MWFRSQVSLSLRSLIALSATSIPLSTSLNLFSVSAYSFLSWLSFGSLVLEKFLSLDFNSSSYLLLLNFTESNSGFMIFDFRIPPMWIMRCLTLLKAMVLSSPNLFPWALRIALFMEKPCSDPAFPCERVNKAFTKQPTVGNLNFPSFFN